MIVDAAVHPLMGDEEYRARLPKPWRDQAILLPDPFGNLFPAPFPEIHDKDGAGDPFRMAQLLFDERDVDVALLTPLTRGLLPNPRHQAAVVRVTNEWLQERWLEASDRYFASIRVPITDSYAAIREIEKWAGDRRFVQIAVPLRALAPYGDERYFPIWQAASELGLPVYVQDDLATGVEYPRSSVGQPVHFAENDALRAMLSIAHLSSLITSGMYERLPGLRFVFGDGGIDLVPPLMWRLDSDWRSDRVEIPWVTELPSVIAPRFARFVTQVQDGTTDGQHADAALRQITRAEHLLIFGSHHPYWDSVNYDRLLADWPPEASAAVLATNVLEVMPRLSAQLV